jgi:lactate permease
MSTVRALAGLLPCLGVAIVVLAFGWSGLAAAGLAAAVALLLFGGALYGPPTLLALEHATIDATLLTLVVAAMVLPGILFVEASRRHGSPAAIARLVETLHLPTSRAVILVAVGIGILVESLTGMGVSVLVSMPLLLTLVDRRRAIALGLIGVGLMPWGALAISGLVGAKLAGMAIEPFAWEVWTLSGPVAFSLPILCWLLTPAAERSSGDLATAIGIGALFAAVIGVTSAGIGIEVAGVGGALAITVALAAAARRTPDWRDAVAAPALWPYGALIAAVGMQKLTVLALDSRGAAPVLSTGRITWSVLTTPGVALAVATLATLARRVDASALAFVMARGWRAMTTVFLFMLSARLLVEIGAIAALAGMVSGLGAVGALVATALLGAVSGFVTGSGITGNALFMPSAAEVGRSLEALPLFAALQNSAAGHVAMASLPVAAILMATLPARRHGDDRLVLLIGLGLAVSHMTVLLAGALVRCHWLGPC